MYSASFRQVVLTLQKRQCSPALKSPLPFAASCAVGARTSFAQRSSSSLEMMYSLMLSRLGWNIAMLTADMSYIPSNKSRAPRAYNIICGLFSERTSTPLPYLKSITESVPSATITQSPVPNPSGTHREKSSFCSIRTMGSLQATFAFSTCS